MQPHPSGHSGSSAPPPPPAWQPRHQRDEITSVETFRAILERGSMASQSQHDASLKHQTSHMSEESEDNV